EVVSVLRPVIYGLVFAFILNVLMGPIENKLLRPLADKNRAIARIKRPLAIILTFLVLMIILALVFLLVLPKFVESIVSLASYLPQYVEDFSKFLDKTLKFYGLSGLSWDNWADYAAKALQQIGSALTNTVPQLLNFTVSVTGGIIHFLFGLIFSVYILAQKENLCKKTKAVMKAYLPESFNNKVFYIANTTNETFKSFLGGQCLDSLCLGTITFIVLSLIQMPYALVIAVTVGVTNMRPIIGPILGTIPCAFIILVISPVKAIILVAVIILLQEFESKVIYPRIVGGRVGLDGLWVLMAVVVGGGLFGLIGIIFAVPTFAVIGKILGNNMEKRLGGCPWDRKESSASKKKRAQKGKASKGSE
ncbi:MAG: AI-2E family transporter, partial [Bacillota bacterium]|nr:AI-2E family transporter [Bacillota bacterium]